MSTRGPESFESVRLPARWTLSSFILAAGFGLTGAGTVMLGTALPLLSHRWALSDAAAGSLFFAQFFGASLGAVFAGPNRVFSLRIGYALLVASAVSLAFAGPHIACVSFFLYGLGLGMTMTSTSLLFSDRYCDDRAAKMEAINFVWSAGATAGPALFFPFLRAAQFSLLVLVLAGVCLALLLWALFAEHSSRAQIAGVSPQPVAGALPALLFPLIGMTVCAVGIEAALGGWLTTFSQRSDPALAAKGVFATSVFFAGIMSGRIAFSTRLLAKFGRHRGLHICLWGMAIAALTLLTARTPATILIASGLCGLFVGPVYPLLLSFMLEISPRGWIFAMGGIGSAIFPWLTGLVSARSGSLRYGLAAPCAAILLMIALRAAMPLAPEKSR